MTILDDAKPGMDSAVRPQDDLFGHLNGTWLATVEIPSDRSSWGPFVMLADEAEQRVRVIIEDAMNTAAAGKAPEGSTLQQIGDLYNSFMDEERAEELGVEPIRPDLARLAGIDSIRDLIALVGEMERRGGGGFFRSYVDSDDKDSERYLVNILQGGIGLPDESYYREEKFAEIRTAYLVHLSKMFQLAGYHDADGAAQRILDLESQIAGGHWERAETRDVLKTYNLMTFDQIVELAPAFEWAVWRDAVGATEQTVAELTVRQPSFFAHLSTLLHEVPLGHWKDWVAAKMIRGGAPYLTKALSEEQFDFYGRTLNGTPEQRARWKRGVAFVEGAVGEAVGEEYVARHFPPSSKAMMDDLVANLLKAYRRSITDLDWMSEETKQRAFKKLDTFHPKIGYPVRFRDYSALDVVPGDLLGNAQRAATFEHERQLAKVGAPVDRDEWFMLPQTVNAYYNPGTNEICFPAGILQKPFFDPEADPAENYGGIGAVIGHEIGHGFDDQGSQFDQDGNLNDWWTESDREAFTARKDRLIDQYSGFSPRSLPGEFVNGALTVGENIGDLGGLTIALKAYRISLDGADEPVNDGSTGSQRVFMNWAYVWRTKRRTEQEQQFLTIDPHSPPEFRANIVRNLDEFHEAFGTAPGDGLWLAPEDRIRIW
jgi:endothelin-converting enzyme/putative endopeptidase